MNRYLISVLLGATGVLAMPAAAQVPSELATLKAEMARMQSNYAAQMRALEKRLDAAEAKAAAAQQNADNAQSAAKTAVVAAGNASKTATDAGAKAQAATEMVSANADKFAQALTEAQANNTPPPPPPTSNNSFNPGIAAVLNGFYFAARHDPNASQGIAGVMMGGEAGMPQRGFSIGESEVSFAANIDPFMSGFLDISFNNANEPSVEEAYILSKDLPWGFTAKGGRFLSGIGYINERHSHDWLFSDAPLPYRAFLNNQYGDDGVQLRWLAPTDQFLEFGAEVFRGDSWPAAGAKNMGAGTYTAFVHTGNDINDSSSWLAALSYLHSDAMGRTTPSGVFNGRTDLGIASGVFKWAPDGNPVVQNFQLSTEFFFDEQQGSYNGVSVNQDRWGWYVYGDYQFMPRWSFGLRYAALGTAKVPLSLAGTELDDFGHAPQAETALLEFDSSEFGRFRAQYTHDEGGRIPNDELLLQFTVIYGPHGAHRY